MELFHGNLQLQRSGVPSILFMEVEGLGPVIMAVRANREVVEGHYILHLPTVSN